MVSPLRVRTRTLLSTYTKQRTTKRFPQGANAVLSGDGNYLAHNAVALLPEDTNDLTDIYVHAVVSRTATSITPNTAMRGNRRHFLICGSAFFPGARAYLGSRVAVNSVTVISEANFR